MIRRTILALLLLCGRADAALIHHWTFTEGSGFTATAAVGGLTVALGSGVSWVAGRVGTYALRFDGSADGVGTFTGTNIGQTYSACLWLNYNDGGDGVVLGAGGVYDIFIDGAGGGSSIYLNEGSNFVSVVHGGFSGSTWYHVCVTRATTSVKFYKNGSQIGTTQTLGGTSDRVIDAMGAKSSGSNPCACDLDDIRYYDTELSSGDVTTLYNSYFAETRRQGQAVFY